MNADFALLLAGMRDDFIRDLPERCDLLEQCVLALERGRGGAFDDLYRHIHSLKGFGGTFGIELITRICHQFESFISEARKRFDPLAVSYALSYVDLLRRVAEAPERESLVASTIEQDSEQLRISSMPGCASALLVEPSVAARRFCPGRRGNCRYVWRVWIGGGLRWNYCCINLSIYWLPHANCRILTLLRRWRRYGKDIPVILISSNSVPVPTYLNINTTIKRDAEFVSMLARCAGDVLAG